MAGKRKPVAGIGLMGFKRKREHQESPVGKKRAMGIVPEVIGTVFTHQDDSESPQPRYVGCTNGSNQGRQVLSKCSGQTRNLCGRQVGRKLENGKTGRRWKQCELVDSEEGDLKLGSTKSAHHLPDAGDPGVEVFVQQDEGCGLKESLTPWCSSLGAAVFRQEGTSHMAVGGDSYRTKPVICENTSGSGSTSLPDVMDTSEAASTCKLQDSVDSSINLVRENSDARESSKAWLWVDGWSGNWDGENRIKPKASTSDMRRDRTVPQHNVEIISGVSISDPESRSGTFSPQMINLNPKARKGAKFQVLTKSRRSGKRRSSKVGSDCARLSRKMSERRLSVCLEPKSIESTQAPIEYAPNKHERVQTTPLGGTAVCSSGDKNTKSILTAQQLRVMSLLQIVLSNPGGAKLQASSLVKNGVISGFASVLGKGDKCFAVIYAYVILAWVKGNIDIPSFAGKEIMETVKLLLIKDQNCASEVGGISELSNQILLEAIESTTSRDLLEVIKSNLLSGYIPSSEAGCSCSVTLTALRLLIDNNSSSPCLEALKESMRVNGVLDAICDQMVLSWHRWPARPGSSTEAADFSSMQRSMWKVQSCLDLLCCVTNASDLSQKHILHKLVEPLNKEDKVLFPAYVASQFCCLRPQFPVLASAREHGIQSLKGLLGLLMNLGHSSGDCIEVLVNQGVIEACAELVVFCCGGESKSIPEECQLAQITDKNCGKPISDDRLNDIRDRIVQNASSMECMLGLLINVCERRLLNRQKLISMEFPNRAALKPYVDGGILELLSCMLLALGVWRSSVEPRAVTMEDLDRRDQVKAGDLVKMCTGVLIGYLVEDDVSLQKAVAGYLYKKSLQPVVKQLKLMLKCCSSSLSPVTSCDQAAIERMIKKLS